MTKQPFTFKTISLAVRPARIVMLIKNDDSDWQDTILRIIEWFSTCWGGAYSLISPTDGNNIDDEFWLLMEIFDPDYIYYYQKTMLDIKLSRPDEYKNWLKREADDFKEKNPESNPDDTIAFMDKQSANIGIEHFTISDTLEAELKKRLNPFEGIIHKLDAASRPIYPLTDLSITFEGMNTSQRILSPQIEASKELQLCLHSIVGKASDRLIESKYDGRTSEYLYEYFPHSWNEESVHKLIQTALRKENDFWMMPYPMTMVGLSYYHKTAGFEKKPVIILGDTIKDFCIYYNLSRLQSNTYWLSMKTLNSYIEKSKREGKVLFEGETSYVLWLKNAIENVFRKLKQKIFLYSTSLGEAEFTLLKRTFDEVTVIIMEGEKPISNYIEIQSDIAKLLQDVMRVYQEDVPKKTYIEQFFQGESVNFLNTPIPKKFPKIPPYGHFWITDVIIDGYLPAHIKSLGEKTIIYKDYHSNLTRVSLEGFSYFCPYFGYFYGWGGIENILVRPKLKLFDDFTIVEELFKENNYFIRYSDKGDYHREICGKFGNFDKLAEFVADEKRRNLLLKYCDESNSEEGEGIFVDGRRYLWFDEIKRFFETETRDIIDNLLENKILYRGFIFKCEKCRNADWYSVEEVNNTFKCSRCNTEQIYKQNHWRKPPEEPRWYYKLDEVVYQGIKHNMHVPVLAIRKLKKTATDGFHYAPEIEIRKDPTSEKPDLELDFITIIDGKVLIGEATKENELSSNANEEREQLTNLRDITLAVQAKKVVLATFSNEWSERTKKTVNEIFSSTVCSPLFLTKQELLSL